MDPERGRLLLDIQTALCLTGPESRAAVHSMLRVDSTLHLAATIHA